MCYNKKYSLGIYVNRNVAYNGGDGNPHVFLGLKIEKVQCNDMQIQMQENLYQHYLKHNMLEQANQCRINIEQMQCFVADKTLLDLQKELSEKYKYSITSSDEFQAWKDTILSSIESINEDFDKALRETFNNDFTFLRQCYADITEPFFEWLESVKKESIKPNDTFDEFENLFNEFVESKDNDMDFIIKEVA
ncbi:hypothetical protein CQA53_11230 [Helicobacter didelphidarum]|uniref:Uncharacterized protein n=1 Tax=Helicobacter didelphidarum TaxID=2040648 RepID=A0A3D8I3N9_9HELI|nr:hypothetical protein [Helicobacter didelphidarum]RDU59790.1 hypothetical protein CQA53_11230 [Helicobacter didelphidarum]